MYIVVILLIVAMAITAIGLLSIATIEFLKSVKSKANNQEKEEIKPVCKKPAWIEEESENNESEQPSLEQREVKADQPSARAQDGNAVTFGVSGISRLTLAQEYKRASRKKRKWFEKITEQIFALEKIRVKEGKYALTALQGQDTIAKVQFVKGEVCVDCTVINSDLKTYGKESGTKIKQKPMRFKITDETQLEASLFTVKIANQSALDARNRKKQKEKTKDSNN